MSRSGYTEDFEETGLLNLYRASVDRAIKGKRGQAFLREMAVSLDAMPEKKLIADELIDEFGQVCAIGAVCEARGLDASKIDYEDPDSVASAVGIASSMAAEIEYMNDEGSNYFSRTETPEIRWQRMRDWVQENIAKL